MNKKFIKKVVSLFAILLIGTVSYAQKYKTHSVKRGESLESISKTYNVGIDDILIYNKEIKKNQKLTANTILIVPLDKQIKENESTTVTTAIVVTEKKPIRFISYKVKKRENIFRISKEYNISEDDIKKYNKMLYSEQLKKGMVLKIPVFKKEAAVVSVNESSTIVAQKPYTFTSYKVKRRETISDISNKFSVTQEQIKRHNKKLYSNGVKRGMTLKIPHYREVVKEEVVVKSYLVKAKETRWSIASKYGITVDSLLLLNPSLSRTSDYLYAGQELNIPEKNLLKNENSTVTKSPDFIIYTVPAKMTFYSLERAYGVTEAVVKELNPSVIERGLQEGMEIKIPTLKKQVSENSENKDIVNTDNFIFYVVSQGQGELSLSRDLGFSFSELVTYNPVLRDGIKSGMVLKIPKESDANFNVVNSLIVPEINLIDKIDITNKPKIMVLLPFRLDILNLSNAASTKKEIRRRKDVNISLGLYSGMQIALDYVKEMGLSVDVTVFDTESTRNVNAITKILSREDIGRYSAIVGRLDSNTIAEVAKKASTYNVPVVAPYVSDNELRKNNIFYSIPADNQLREKMLNYMLVLHKDENIIIIADSKHKIASSAIRAKFPKAKIVTLIKDLSIHIDKFERLLSTSSENWVFVETSNIGVSKHASSVLNSFNTKKTKVRMFTTNLSKAFDRNEVDNMVLSNLNFTYPSVNKEAGNGKFAKLYRAKFGFTPNKYAIRGFDIMYDVLLKLGYKNNLFEVSEIIGETEYVANKFNYINNNLGFINTAAYIMQYKDMQIIEVKPVVKK